MASMKAFKPQGSSASATGPAKVQQAAAGAAKPAAKKEVQKPQEPKKVSLNRSQNTSYFSRFMSLCNKLLPS